MERGNLIAELTQNGQMIDMVREDASSIENNAKWNQISQTKSIHIGDADYVLQNRMGFLNFLASGFSQLLKKEQMAIQSCYTTVASSSLQERLEFLR